MLSSAGFMVHAFGAYGESCELSQRCGCSFLKLVLKSMYRSQFDKFYDEKGNTHIHWTSQWYHLKGCEAGLEWETVVIWRRYVWSFWVIALALLAWLIVVALLYLSITLGNLYFTCVLLNSITFTWKNNTFLYSITIICRLKIITYWCHLCVFI